jgi:hypothetical protein
VGHHLDLDRNRHAQQAERQDRDKTGDKDGAKRRMGLQQTEIQQPGLSVHYSALLLFSINARSFRQRAYWLYFLSPVIRLAILPGKRAFAAAMHSE